MNRLTLMAFLLVACGPGDDTGDDDDTGDADDTGTPTEVVSPLDPDVAPVTAGDWARPTRRTTWHLQLQGTLNTSYDADLYDVDLLDTDAATVAALQADGRWVWCHFSAGTLEEWRADAGAFPAAVVGEAAGDEERWLDVRRAEVHTAMAARLDLAATKGCDGVAPDGIDGFEAETGFPLTAADQRGYNRFLFNGAHTRGLGVAQVNGLAQVADLVAYADVAIVDRCHEYDECDAVQPYLDADKAVLNAEYLAAYVADPPAFCRTAIVFGTRSLLLDPALDDSVRVACDTDFPSTTGLADVVTYTTYYGRDADRLAELAHLDLAIVQPLLTADQRAALQARAKLAVYLSIGEIGLSNTYLIDGEEQLGQVVYDAHPEWFRDDNPFFDSYFADANQTGWQDFVLEQAGLLLDQGYDGLFLDTVDTVDVYPDTIPGMVTLIGRLRDEHPDAVLVQNRGINVIPQSGPDVDALMFEVFSSYFDSNLQDYTETNTAQIGYPELVDKAVDYRLAGGVVLAQDFALPGGAYDDLICYARERALLHGFVPAYADKFFQDGLFDYPSACPWPEEPLIGVAFEPMVAHLPRGRALTVDVLLDGDGGFSDAVTLSLGAAPSGVTAALGVATVPGTVDLSAAEGAGVGVGILPVTATSADQQRIFDLHVVVHDETIWVTNAGLSDVVAFDEPADAAAPVLPSRRTGDLVAQPYAIAVHDDGTQWVVENVGDPTATQPAGRVLMYEPFDLTTPELVVTGGLNYPTGVAIDAAGKVWVANSALDWTGTPRGTPDIASVQGAAATPEFALQHASLGYPRQIAFDPDGNLWMTTTFGLVLGYTLPATGTPDPFAVVAGTTASVFDTVNGLTFDADGDLWLSGSLTGAARVVEIAAGSWTTDGLTSQVDATAMLTDGLYGPWGLAFDAAGSLWVVNSTDAADDTDSRGSLLRFDTLTTGAAPAQTIDLESRYTLGIAVARP